MVSALIAIALCSLPEATSAFSSSPPASRSRRVVVVSGRSPSRPPLRSSSIDDVDDDGDFDPFARSPHSFGSDDDDASEGDDALVGIGEISGGGGAGFLAIAEALQSSMDAGAGSSFAAPVGAVAADDGVADFDPLLSPHAYANGADAAPSDAATKATAAGGASAFDLLSSSAYANGGAADYYAGGPADGAAAVIADPPSSPEELFDPLLSPHAYADGVDAGPVDSAPIVGSVVAAAAATERRRLGILLIDHGSRRPASNAHIHDVARMYEGRLNSLGGRGDEKGEGVAEGGNGSGSATATTTIVRAAHMEITEPSIASSLRDIVAIDRVERVVCVPYFLSPGRHATEDVPELIEEAKAMLREEGLTAEVLMSDALGTHLESMMGAVDNLVQSVLSEQENGSF